MKNKKKIEISHTSSIDATLSQMPKYNPYQGGTGAHKSKKNPDRNKRKEAVRKEINEEYHHGGR